MTRRPFREPSVSPSGLPPKETTGAAVKAAPVVHRCIRAVLAAPDAAAAERLWKSLEAAGFVVSAQAATAAEAVAAVVAHRPTLCLFASELAGEEFHPVREIAQTSPETCVVVLARRGDAHEMVGVLRAGAAGYLPATRTGKKLIESLELILAGYTPLPWELLSEL